MTSWNLDKVESTEKKMSEVVKNTAMNDKKMHKGHVSVLEELNWLLKWWIH